MVLMGERPGEVVRAACLESPPVWHADVKETYSPLHTDSALWGASVTER